MIGRIKYVRITDVHVSQDVLQKFDCKHPDFNDFLVNDAINDMSEGKGVTYILIDEDEVKTEVSTIFAFATLRATSLYYQKDNMLCNVPCAEIKYFAISRFFQKATCGDKGTEKYYSTVFFEELLSDLYVMAIEVLGFTGIFLSSNESGVKLYKRKKFLDASDYIIPYDEDDKLGKCKPMYLPIFDDIENIFGI